MHRVRLRRDEFIKRVKCKERRFIDTLDACIHIMIHFNRDICKSCLLVLLHSIVALNYMLRNVDTIM